MTLKESLIAGGRSTLDAIEQDLARMKSGGLPSGLIEAIGQLLSAPAFAPMRVPRYHLLTDYKNPITKRVKFPGLPDESEIVTGYPEVLTKTVNRADKPLDVYLNYPSKVTDFIRDLRSRMVETPTP